VLTGHKVGVSFSQLTGITYNTVSKVPVSYFLAVPVKACFSGRVGEMELEIQVISVEVMQGIEHVESIRITIDDDADDKTTVSVVIDYIVKE